MERYCLPTLALPPLVHDALTVVGCGAVLLIGFVVINVGLLLPGLFAWLERSLGESRGGSRVVVARFDEHSVPQDGQMARSLSFLQEAEMLCAATRKVLHRGR